MSAAWTRGFRKFDDQSWRSEKNGPGTDANGAVYRHGPGIVGYLELVDDEPLPVSLWRSPGGREGSEREGRLSAKIEKRYRGAYPADDENSRHTPSGQRISHLTAAYAESWTCRSNRTKNAPRERV